MKITQRHLVRPVAALAVIAVIAGILYFWLIPGNTEDRSPCHPFRSPEAKERFLKLYDDRAAQWPVASETVTLNTSYGKTFIRIGGPAGAPPMVLLHGIGGNSLQWIPNVKDLSADYRTFAVDNVYDYGKSVYTRAVTGPRDYVRWLNEVLDGLGLRGEAVFMGLSYGGWIAARYAVQHPERARAVVLLAPGATVLPVRLEWLVRAGVCAIPREGITMNFMKWLYLDLYTRDRAGKLFVEEWAHRSYTAVRSYRPKNIVKPDVFSDRELRKLAMPVLFLVGENEKLYDPLKAVERLTRVNPEIETRLIKGAGHDLSMVKSGEVNMLVLEFLEGI